MSYNVFNVFIGRKFSYLMLEPQYIAVSQLVDHLHESKHQKFTFVAYFLNIYRSVCQLLVLQGIDENALPDRIM